MERSKTETGSISYEIFPFSELKIVTFNPLQATVSRLFPVTQVKIDCLKPLFKLVPVFRYPLTFLRFPFSDFHCCKPLHVGYPEFVFEANSWADLFLHFCGFPLQTDAAKHPFLCARLFHKSPERLLLLINPVDAFLEFPLSIGKLLFQSFMPGNLVLSEDFPKFSSIVRWHFCGYPSQKLLRRFVPLCARSQTFKLRSEILLSVFYLLLDELKLVDLKPDSNF
jgi:hypothetical protein